ncbi:MAG TPA: efflux RND transporter periplasmic adaptor subunit [Gemmatimonadaceae bacterium]|jgi:RND family efflux transporter MFP subunit|nr:efflux RND transporter periplasmic adaptor subunit [Gemmatimonadaceae bacterium]
MPSINHAVRLVPSITLLLSFAAGCSQDAAGSDAGGGRAAAGGASGGAGGAGAAGGAARGGPGGRPAPSITLAPTDVAIVAPTTIEDGIALTGDLRPSETIDVRARIEGDLTDVYVREGQQVNAGQLLARFEASEQESSRASAEADRVAARAEVSNAQWTLDQNASLFKAGAIAERDYKVSQQAVATARARLAAAEARLRASGNEARDTRVLAPFGGVVDKRLVDGGVHLARGAPMFSIVRSQTLELAAAVPARQAAAVRVGQVVHFVADARKFDGKVARVSPTIDPMTRAVTVYVQVPNPGSTLRGGTFATGRVVSRTLNNVLAVPGGALRQAQDNGRPFVYRIDGKTLNIAQVQVGVVDEQLGLAQITDGLAAGDKVVVGNVGTLGRGMQVMMAGAERSGGGGSAGAGSRAGAGGTGGTGGAGRRQ